MHVLCRNGLRARVSLRHLCECTFEGTLSKPSNVNVVFGQEVGRRSHRAAKSGREVKTRANVTEKLGFAPIIT